jgi:hypothetical protein
MPIDIVVFARFLDFEFRSFCFSSFDVMGRTRTLVGKSDAIAGNGDQPAKLRQRKLVQPSLTKSMPNSSLRYFFNRVHLAHFDIDVRKLIFE